jgi:hypothetical protein
MIIFSYGELDLPFHLGRFLLTIILFSRSDFVYMVPPFLAMYGAIHKNTTLMDEAYDQIRLYRDALRDDSGLWKHIVGEGDGLDQGSYTRYDFERLSLTYPCCR